MSGPTLVTVSPYGPAGASARVRVYDWLRWLGVPARSHGYLGLAENGPRTLAAHPLRVLGAEAGLRALARRGPERLLLQREASPLSRGGLERDLLGRAGWSAYDFDDALYVDDGTGRRGRWAGARRLAPKGPKCRTAALGADRVIAGNEVLADWAGGLGAEVVVIPSCVDPADYAVRHGRPLDDPPRLVWLGSPSTEPYLLAIGPALCEVNRRTGARLTVIGGRPGALGALEALCDRRSWTPDVTASLADHDLAVAPLPDTPWARGKCGYKLVQYAAAGLTGVSSPVGANGPILDRLGFRPATTVSEWTDQLLALLSATPTDLDRWGAGARRSVEDDFSFAAWADRWRAAVGLA